LQRQIDTETDQEEDELMKQSEWETLNKTGTSGLAAVELFHSKKDQWSTQRGVQRASLEIVLHSDKDKNSSQPPSHLELVNPIGVLSVPTTATTPSLHGASDIIIAEDLVATDYAIDDNHVSNSTDNV
jgi:hypothetical protein